MSLNWKASFGLKNLHTTRKLHATSSWDKNGVNRISDGKPDEGIEKKEQQESGMLATRTRKPHGQAAAPLPLCDRSHVLWKGVNRRICSFG